MADLNNESLAVWKALKPMIDREIAEKTRGMIQRRRATVSTAPDVSSGLVGVTEPFCDEVSIPFTDAVSMASVGDPVWIEYMYGATNSFVSMYGDGKSMAPYADNAGFHNSIYRGANLGSSLTAEQRAEISAGTFKNMYIGDYWEIDAIDPSDESMLVEGEKWRIAAFDYFYGAGYPQTYTHHVVIVPDSPLYSTDMNMTGTTDNGYAGTIVFGEMDSVVVPIINRAFGNGHILAVRKFICNAATNGVPSGSSIYTRSADLMSEIQMYGTKIYGVTNSGSNAPNFDTECVTQFPLFRFDPMLIGRATFSDIASSTEFAHCNYRRRATTIEAEGNAVVRPYFCIQGE